MDNISWLSNLKLRASYGLTGNNNIIDNAPYDLLYAANYPLGVGTGAINNGQVPSRDILSNPDITWERTYQFNGGIDIALFKNKITLSVDAYQSKTDQLLLQQNIMSFAGAARYWNNIGSLQNNGVEVELTTNNIRTKNFKWSTTANFSHNENKLLELGQEAFF